MEGNELVRVDKGKAQLFLHPGQEKAWDSNRRFVFVIAGTQSGKTTFGPWWLYREIDRCGAGDYLAVTATYDLFKLKMLPEMLRVFVDWLPGWNYQKSERVIHREALNRQPLRQHGLTSVDRMTFGLIVGRRSSVGYRFIKGGY